MPLSSSPSPFPSAGAPVFRATVHGLAFANRSRHLEGLQRGQALVLIPDPPADVEQVWVHGPSGDPLGHLPGEIASWLAPWMRGGGSARARVLKVGDVMQDSALLFADYARAPQGLDDRSGFVLATLHRAENTDDPARLAAIVEALNTVHRDVAEVVLPLHPRTAGAIVEQRLELTVTSVEPVGYFEMVWLLNRCSLVLTDSGGVQKEAFFFGKACVTMRDQTEWVELIQEGANVLVGADRAKIVAQAQRHLNRQVQDEKALYGGGQASQAVVEALLAS